MPTACITFVGRADDVFKASDYRISPFELESALIEHEAVAEVAVVPSPDPLRLAVPKAFLSLAAGATPDRALGRGDLRVRAARSSRRTSGCAGSSSSTSCRRRSPARSAASSCASRRPSGVPPARGPTASSSRTIFPGLRGTDGS